MRAGPSIVPSADPKGDFDGGQDIESLAARRAAKRARGPYRFSLKPSLPVAICGMLAVIVGLVAARQQIVRVLPQTASLYATIGLPVNLRGLVFNDIKTIRETRRRPADAGRRGQHRRHHRPADRSTAASLRGD